MEEPEDSVDDFELLVWASIGVSIIKKIPSARMNGMDKYFFIMCGFKMSEFILIQKYGRFTRRRVNALLMEG